MSGLSFPMTAAVRDAIINYKNQKTNYVQLSINISKEIIELEDQTSCDSKSLPSRIPEGAPRYHLFRFDHTHEGDYLKSTSNYLVMDPLTENSGFRFWEDFCLILAPICPKLGKINL